jgi:subtilisin family serine protease
MFEHGVLCGNAPGPDNDRGMSWRIAAAAGVSGAVIVTMTCALARLPAVSGEAALIGRYPQLARRVGQPPSAKVVSVIADPFLGWKGSTPADGAYNARVQELFAAQVRLTAQRQALLDARHLLAGHQAEIEELMKRLEEMEDEWLSWNVDGVPGETRTVADALRHAQLCRDAVSRDVEHVQRLIDRTRKEIEAAEAAAGAIRPVRDPAPEDGEFRTYIERDTILLLLHDGVPIEKVDALRERYGLAVRSGIPRISLLVVEARGPGQETPEGQATRLRALVQALNGEKEIVETAVQNAFLDGTFIPQPNAPFPRNWFDDGDPLVKGMFPQAWNFIEAIPAGRVRVGVLDKGFRPNPDLSTTPAREVPNVRPCGEVDDAHGSGVAGIIGAAFNNGLGADGGTAGFAEIITCAAEREEVDVTGLTPRERAIVRKKMLARNTIFGLETLLAQGVTLINASIGYNWKVAGVVPEDEPDVQTIVADHGRIVRKLLRDHPDVLLIAAAGNDGRRQAKWASPFNWAALGDPDEDSAPAENIIVVNALRRDGTELRNDSNDGGTINAVGDNVITTIIPEQLPGTGTGFLHGTSAAAPLVTAAVALMRAIDSNLSVRKIKENLGIAPNVVPTLDAFKAVSRSVADPDAALADLVRDGSVDEADFLAFRSEFQRIRDGLIPDLNRDGRHTMADAKFSRFDLDGDTDVDEADLDVMIAAWDGTRAQAALLKSRLNGNS